MPVNVLFCEGRAKSPDIRLLSALVTGLTPSVTVKPAGSKYGLGTRIRAERDARPKSAVAGIRDRDFDVRDSASACAPPLMEPPSWLVQDNTMTISIGWYWERTEIENYLIDPAVVSHILDNTQTETFAQHLNDAAQSLVEYTTARMALSKARLRFNPLPNSWGKKRGKNKHAFPEKISDQDCRKGIENVVASHTHEREISVADVLTHYDTLLPQFQASGNQPPHFITHFSGKDLLYGIETQLKTLGFASPGAFREQILTTIEQSPDVWTWLPEWHALRDAIQAYDAGL